MASKKAGRLAGLAALAGLAYMNKDKLFGAKGETKAAETKAETKVKDTAAEDAKAAAKRDADEETMGYGSFGNAAMFEKEPGFETKTTPDKVASASLPASKPARTSRFAPAGSPVAKAAAGIGNAKPVVAQGGDRSARSDMQKAGKTGNASPVVAQGGDRSTRSDNAKPVFAPGGDRSARADMSKPAQTGNAKAVVAQGGDRSTRSNMVSAGPKSGSGFGGPIYYPPPRGAKEDANIDKEAYNKFLEKRPGIMERMRAKDKAMADDTMKRGGKVKKMASGGMTSSASKRGDGIASKGKTRGRMC